MALPTPDRPAESDKGAKAKVEKDVPFGLQIRL